MKIQFRAEVAEDLEIAWQWYEARQPGLGDALLVELRAVLTRIEQLPRSFSSVHGEVRRALLRRFPYAVFFMVESDAILVVALLHQATHPARWPRR